MRNGLRIDHPTGARRELHLFTHTAGLKCRIFFHDVMQAHHEVIIWSAFPLRDEGGQTRCLGDLFSGADKRTVCARYCKPGGREGANDLSEWLAHNPVARASRVNVVEEAQNAPAVRGTRREGVGVEQIVASADWKIAALLFEGTETCVVEPPAPLVRREKLG